jgi:hypothetical protein
LRNILHTHLESLTAKDGWVPPITVIVPIAAALLAGVKNTTVENGLYVALGAALLWLAAKLRTAYRCRGHRGIDSIMDELRPPRTPQPAARGQRASGAAGYWPTLWAALRRTGK